MVRFVPLGAPPDEEVEAIVRLKFLPLRTTSSPTSLQ
jgi:hypothetical protein